MKKALILVDYRKYLAIPLDKIALFADAEFVRSEGHDVDTTYTVAEEQISEIIIVDSQRILPLPVPEKTADPAPADPVPIAPAPDAREEIF